MTANIIKQLQASGLRVNTWKHHAFVSLYMVLVVISYGYFSGVLGEPFPPPPNSYLYYGMLGEAFLEGHTNVAGDPHYKLLEASDPYNSTNLEYWLVDASLYKGQYYLYFGPVPALLVWIPIKLLTGIAASDAVLAFILASLGSCCLILLVYLIALRHGHVPMLGMLFAMLSIAYGTWLPYILHGARIYEVAVIGAYCFSSMGALLLAVALIYRPNNKFLLGLASLSFGLAVGCRATHAVNSIFLLLAFIYLFRHAGKREPVVQSSLWKSALCLIIPWVLCLIGLALYNMVRFDNVLESGWRYTLSAFHPQSETFKPIQAYLLLPNLYVYLFKVLPWAHTDYMPFIVPDIQWEDRHVPWKGFVYWPYLEPVYGLFVNSPFSLFFLLFAGNAWRQKSLSPELRTIMNGYALYGCALLGFLTIFFATCVRYAVDFTPSLMVVACMYYVHLLQTCKNDRYYRLLLWVGALTMLYGLCVGIMLGNCGLYYC